MFSIETEWLTIRDMTPFDEEHFASLSQDEEYQRYYSEEDCDPQKYRDLAVLFIQQSSEVPRVSFQLALEYRST